jgi:Tfp pilus assembly protein PilF
LIQSESFNNPNLSATNTGVMNMSEEILQPAIEKFSEGDLEGAVQMLDEMCKSNKDVAAVHHTYAEFANMLNVEAQDDIIPGGKIMMAYKKAMNLDEENDEYIVDFADFALECRRIPQAIKEYERYARRLELADIPIDDRLYMAARNLVDAIEVVDPTKSNPQVMPWLKSAIKWSVGGLGYSPEEASSLLLEE